MAMHGSCSRAKAPLRLTNSDNANEVRNIRRKNFRKDSVCSFDLITPPQQPQIKSTGYLANRYNHPYFDEREERKQKVTINVSGERYQTFVDTLDRFPKTLLGNAIKRERFYDDVEDEYFFDRDRSAFNAILYYYQSNGRLYCPLTVPMTILVTEAKFFQLGNDALKQVLDLDNENKNDILPKNKWQRKIWCIFEHPETSRTAHCITLFSMIMILLSVCILCLETLQVFKGGKENLYSKLQNVSDSMNKVMCGQNSSLLIAVNINNKTFSKATAQLCNCFCEFRTAASKQNEESQINNTTQATNDKIDWTYIFHTCEAVFVAWFTFEYLIRLLTAPEKCVFLKNYLNIIDIISILPFYITAALNRTNGFGLENFRVIRLVRVFRIFKLSRHSKGLQILGFTLQASMRELGLMIFFLAMGVILFSSAVYYLEEGNFTSIPDAFWWAIITMCTVGYGDKVSVNPIFIFPSEFLFTDTDPLRGKCPDTEFFLVRIWTLFTR